VSIVGRGPFQNESPNHAWAVRTAPNTVLAAVTWDQVLPWVSVKLTTHVRPATSTSLAPIYSRCMTKGAEGKDDKTMSNIQQWALGKFEFLSDELLKSGFRQEMGGAVVRDQDPPGARRIQVVLFSDPREPSIRVANLGKLNPSPSLSDDDPEPGPEVHFFDAWSFGSEYDWVKRNGTEGRVTTEEIIERVKNLFASA
jgi:hypothetical protein